MENISEEKYIEVSNLIPIYPDINSERFYYDLYRKKELYENKLENDEKVPKAGSGELMSHQKIISRFLSSYTTYDSLLLYHDMGTGKSCSAFSVTERIRKEQWKEASLEEQMEENIKIRKQLEKQRIDKLMFKGVLILARGNSLLDNLLSELVNVCTDGKYNIEDYETERQKKIRIKKKLAPYYKFETFEKFAKYLKKRQNVYNKVLDEYSNHIIIIDEIHNIRLSNINKNVNVYDEFFKFLHLVKGCKILLMSGTPMKDQASEISDVLNLILPLDKQIPIQQEFNNKYMTNVNGTSIVQQENSKIELKNYFKGYVSYLKSNTNDIEKIFIGQKKGKLKHFIVDTDIMSDFQTKYYIEALEIDKNSDLQRSGIYNNTRQASLFVFPDGSYGSAGYTKYIKTIERKMIYGKKISSHTLSKDFLKILKKKENIEENINYTLLRNIKKYSSKYAKLIENIINNPTQKIFVYCEYISGSGILLLTLLLKLFGYSKSTRSNTNIKQKRFAIVYGDTNKDINNIINMYNQEKNIYGEYIQVLIGSRVIGEGFSLKDVSNINILTPHWNYSETSQAIARGIRAGSHKKLKELNPDNKTSINIYQRVSIPNNNSFSIDLYMYEISEDKDISIKSVERLIKESSIDCALTYNRNKSNRIEDENTRICEYTTCEYSCDGIPNNILDENEIDYNTYNIYYSSDIIENIISKVKILFSQTFYLHFNAIKEKLNNYSLFEIISALENIINQNIAINNKYGFKNYLREKNNQYFLVDNITVSNDIFNRYYAEYPFIKNYKNFDTILDIVTKKTIPLLINKLSKTENDEDFRNIINKLSTDIQEMILELSILAEINNIENNFKNKVLTLFQKYIYTIMNNDDVVSGLHTENSKLLVSVFLDNPRCLNLQNNNWENCSDEIFNLVLNFKQDMENKIINNPDYNYSGLKNSIQNNFCIRKHLKTDDKDIDSRLLSTGMVCKTWNIEDLLNIINELNINIPIDVIDEFVIEKRNGIKIKDLDLKSIFKIIKKLKLGRKLFQEKKPIQDNLYKYKSYLYWQKGQKQNICDTIENTFKQNNILLEGPCGSPYKKKV